jgi:hypothetical protein
MNAAIRAPVASTGNADRNSLPDKLLCPGHRSALTSDFFSAVA